MKLKNETKCDVGVIVARLQVHELHQAHKQIIEFVRSNSDRTIIILGVSPTRNTFQNPLDFKSRKQLVAESYPDVDVYYVNDDRDDHVWSKNLDNVIRMNTNPDQNIILFGARDSFIKHYFGKFPTKELESDVIISGTEVRKKISNFYVPTKDFRAGIIAATASRFATCYQAVDVAILKEDKLLLGRKPNENKLRFIGGFSDVNSDSLESDARREVMEEANVEITGLKYLCSSIIRDWRFRNERDKIKSAFFVADYSFGSPQAGDDIAEIRWVNISEFEYQKELVEEHHLFYNKLVDYLNRNYKD